MRTIQTVNALTCMKTLLFIFNVLFWISGIALLILGIWLHVELQKYVEVGGQYVSGTTSSSITTTTTTYTTSTSLHLSTTTSSTVLYAPYVFVVSGLVVLFLGTLGCCCNVVDGEQKQAVVLYMYASMLSCVVLMEAIGCVSAYSYKTDLKSQFEKSLNESMQVYNVDHGRSSSINLLQTHVHCCGLHSPTDWLTSTHYKRIPGSCCKTNMGCDTRDKRVIHKEGCYTLVGSLIDSNVRVASGFASGVMVFQVVGVGLSIGIGRLVEKTKYEQIVGG